MKQIRIIIFAAIALMCSCESERIDNSFSTDPIAFDVEATGGVVRRTITSTERWIASTDNAWITVSPANGRATTECQFIIDSALTTSPRRGVVRIQNLATWEEQEIVINQQGLARSAATR